MLDECKLAVAQVTAVAELILAVDKRLMRAERCHNSDMVSQYSTSFASDSPQSQSREIESTAGDAGCITG